MSEVWGIGNDTSDPNQRSAANSSVLYFLPLNWDLKGGDCPLITVRELEITTYQTDGANATINA